MSGFIYELFKKKPPAKPVARVQSKHKVLLNPQVIKQSLNDLRLAKTALSIFIPEFKKPSVSYILSIADNRLELDLLKDAASHQALVSSNTFRVIAKQAHVDFVFDTHLLDFKEGDASYFAAFPEKIYHPQRRDTFRLTVPDPIKLLIDLPLPDAEATLIGKIINLSITGAAFIVNTEFKLAQGDIIENCVLHLLGNIDLKLDIEICSKRFLRFNCNRVGIRVGCHFAGISRETEQILAKFITHCELRLKETRQAKIV